MNCKQGDLAIVVRSEAGNQGCILTCIRLASTQEKQRLDYQTTHEMWVTDRLLKSTRGPPDALMFDEYLRPLRGDDGEDEMLCLTGKPADSLVEA